MLFDVIGFIATIVMMLACAQIILWKPTRSKSND